MEEMNAAANHCSLLMESFSKSQLAFQLFGRGEGGWSVDMHLAFQKTILDTCSHFLKSDLDDGFVLI